jgi:hypothetical protein
MADVRAAGENEANRAPVKRGGGANMFGYISFFVAALSLVTSFYQGYLNTKFVELIQSSVARNETARTCKDLIDAYFQVKLRTAQLAAALDREKNANAPAAIAADSEIANSVSRFAALGTYLANFADESRREKYTQLSWELSRIATAARTTAPAGVDKLFEKADAMFAGMNDDCVQSAKKRI